MRKLLNTLYVSTQGAWLSKEGEALKIKHNRNTLGTLPLNALSGIVCFGQVSVSPYLMAHCAEYDISISYLSEHGKFLAKVQGAVSGNVLLRRAQYRMADDEAIRSSISANIITGKINNSRRVLQRAARKSPKSSRLQNACNFLQDQLTTLSPNFSTERIRGIEGECAATYFRNFSELLSPKNKEGFSFTGRTRRPPQDPMNALLSFIYVLLMHDVRSACESWGLDPQVGFLHCDRPGRQSLALDLMEEFRAPLADRVCLSLVNRGQVSPKGFTLGETGGVRMDDDTRKTVLKAWQNKKSEEVQHPFLKERMPWGLVIHSQAGLMARFIRGDIDGYPPFVWR